jgi:hypothetical protein
MKDEIYIAKINWEKASKELSFKFISPYLINLNNKTIKVFAFFPEYGSVNGAIVDIIYAPKYEINRDIIKFAEANNCFYSFLNIEDSLIYDKEQFRLILDDWGKYK